MALLAVLGGVAVAYLVRQQLLRRAEPQLVASWLLEQAERHDIPLTLGPVESPGPGRLRIAWLRLGPTSTARDAPRLGAEDVRIAYDLVVWREPPLHVKSVAIGRATFVVPAVPPRGAAGEELSALVRKLPERLGRFLPGLRLEVDAADFDVVGPQGTAQVRLAGSQWTAAVGRAGRRIDASGRAWPADKPGDVGEATATWKLGEPVHLQLEGAVTDAGAAWTRAAALWPDLASLPVAATGGTVRWRTRVVAPGLEGWTADGSFDFTAAAARVGPAELRGWRGRCDWHARDVPGAGGTQLDAFSLESNLGDVTATGRFGLVDGAPEYAGDVMLYGVRGERLLPWAAPLLAAARRVIADLSAQDVDASTIELHVAHKAGATRVHGEADMGRGFLRATLALPLAQLQVLQLDARRVAFQYDPTVGDVRGEFDLVGGAFEFRPLKLTATGLQGRIEFAPGRLVAHDVHASLPVGEATISGTIPLAADVAADVRVDGIVRDTRGLLDALELPADLHVDGQAVVSTVLRGRPADLDTALSIDATNANVDFGRLLRKPAGQAMRLHGTLQPEHGGLTIEDLTVRLPEGLLRGRAAIETAAGGGRRRITLAGRRFPLESLRRYVPLARSLGGFGVADVDVAYVNDGATRSTDVTLAMPRVRCDFAGSPFLYAMDDSRWRIHAVSDRRIVRVDVTARDLDILDQPLPVGGEAGAPRRSPPGPAEWETVVDFAFDTVRWRHYTGTGLTGRVTHWRGEYHLDPAHLRIFGGEATAAVSLYPSKLADVFVRWNDCDLDAILTQIYNVPNAAAGLVAGHANLYGGLGEWPDWEGLGYVRVELPRIETAHFVGPDNLVPWTTLSADSGWAEWTFDNGTFTVPALRVDKTGIAITGNGDINLAGDLSFSCEAEVDNAVIEQLPLIARWRLSRRSTEDTRRIEFTLRDNITALRPKVRRTSLPAIMGELATETVTLPGNLLFDLLGLE